ncbi:unnamed protein product [Caenorhabditis auriculariae]|uniref:MAM domain-containing protein n=1 Tax=Caenorhabditis auriculariae TaxID=2777116 RepID=A0A8S1GQY2_9PELO|nr:unnamed protein product [Caenorhabditis auriculariae]
MSNQRGCSVATYRYSSECRAQMDRPTYSYPQQSGKYEGFLGANVQARAYSEKRTSSDFARSDVDLRCFSALDCTWQNVDDDYLNWVVGLGSVDPAKLALITGSQYLPGSFDTSFLILASDPKPSPHDGQLVSIAIGCQQSAGILSFRFWRSRARIFGNEPKLDVCTRKYLEAELENCMTVVPTTNHTIVASVPPILEPFVIVLRGYNFENEPEGGLIILDEIEYSAHVDQPENCVSKVIDSDVIEPISAEAKFEEAPRIVSGDTDRYVLESVEFTISDSPRAYLGFKKYIATKGLHLSLCENGERKKCFWSTSDKIQKNSARKWKKEIVFLPSHVSKFFFIAWQAQNETLNHGQVGLTEIAIFSDSKAEKPLC